MNKKNTILTLALAFCLVLALNVGNANAGPSPYYFDDYNCAYLELGSFGMIGQNEWGILAKVSLYGGSDVGIGMYNYNPDGTLGIHVGRDGSWLSHSYQGVWAGSGTTFALAISTTVTELRQLYTTPPAISAAGSDSTKQ